MLPDTKKPNLLLRVPLGIRLPQGIIVQFGEERGKALPFQSCNMSGCVAEYAITKAEIASLQKGANLRLSVRTVRDNPLNFNLPAAGFAAAYAKMTGR